MDLFWPVTGITVTFLIFIWKMSENSRSPTNHYRLNRLETQRLIDELQRLRAENKQLKERLSKLEPITEGSYRGQADPTPTEFTSKRVPSLDDRTRLDDRIRALDAALDLDGRGAFAQAVRHREAVANNDLSALKSEICKLKADVSRLRKELDAQDPTKCLHGDVPLRGKQ